VAPTVDGGIFWSASAGDSVLVYRLAGVDCRDAQYGQPSDCATTVNLPAGRGNWIGGRRHYPCGRAAVFMGAAIAGLWWSFGHGGALNSDLFDFRPRRGFCGHRTLAAAASSGIAWTTRDVEIAVGCHRLDSALFPALYLAGNGNRIVYHESGIDFNGPLPVEL